MSLVRAGKGKRTRKGKIPPWKYPLWLKEISKRKSVKSESPEGVGEKRRDLTELSEEINYRAGGGFQGMEHIKLIAEKKFVDLEKCQFRKMSFR